MNNHVKEGKKVSPFTFQQFFLNKPCVRWVKISVSCNCWKMAHCVLLTLVGSHTALRSLRRLHMNIRCHTRCVYWAVDNSDGWYTVTADLRRPGLHFVNHSTISFTIILYIISVCCHIPGSSLKSAVEDMRCCDDDWTLFCGVGGMFLLSFSLKTQTQVRYSLFIWS